MAKSFIHVQADPLVVAAIDDIREMMTLDAIHDGRGIVIPSRPDAVASIINKARAAGMRRMERRADDEHVGRIARIIIDRISRPTRYAEDHAVPVRNIVPGMFTADSPSVAGRIIV